MAALITGVVKATGFADLPLGDTTIYQFPPEWLDAGVSDFDKDTSKGKNVPGRILGDYSLAAVQFQATFQIGATDGSTDAVSVLNALGALLDRVRVPDWQFEFSYRRKTTDSFAVTEWKCEPAAAKPQWGKFLLHGFMLVQLTVFRDPIPVQGPF